MNGSGSIHQPSPKKCRTSAEPIRARRGRRSARPPRTAPGPHRGSASPSSGRARRAPRRLRSPRRAASKPSRADSKSVRSSFTTRRGSAASRRRPGSPSRRSARRPPHVSLRPGGPSLPANAAALRQHALHPRLRTKGASEDPDEPTSTSLSTNSGCGGGEVQRRLRSERMADEDRLARYPDRSSTSRTKRCVIGRAPDPRPGAATRRNPADREPGPGDRASGTKTGAIDSIRPPQPWSTTTGPEPSSYSRAFWPPTTIVREPSIHESHARIVPDNPPDRVSVECVRGGLTSSALSPSGRGGAG